MKLFSNTKFYNTPTHIFKKWNRIWLIFFKTQYNESSDARVWWKEVFGRCIYIIKVKEK